MAENDLERMQNLEDILNEKDSDDESVQQNKKQGGKPGDKNPEGADDLNMEDFDDFENENLAFKEEHASTVAMLSKQLREFYKSERCP